MWLDSERRLAVVTSSRWRIVVGAVLGIVLVAPCLARAADDPLAKQIEAVIDGKDYKHAHWGILVVDAKTGDAVFSRNPDKFATPASVTKLFSCAATLVALGPDFRFETPIYRRGEIVDGVLKGDLILVGSGDPTFGGRTKKDGTLAFADNDHTYANFPPVEATLTDTNPLAALESLAKQVKAAGIREVDGEILVDDRLFVHTRGTGSGPTLVSPVTVNDNAIDILVTPGSKSGDPAIAKMRPDTRAFQMDFEVSTGEADSPVSIAMQSAGGNQFVVRGSVPAGGKPVVRIFPVEEPALFARTLLIEALRKEGIRVTATLARPLSGEFAPFDAYAKLPRVAVYQSEPLSELVKVCLKVSHNLYASTFPCLIAVKAGKRTAEEGLLEQRKILKSLGVDVGATSFSSSAGGSVADAVTPRATVQLLQAMRKRKEWDVYRAGFPSLGVDGTLATSVGEKSPARGKVFAKTGTLLWPDVMNSRGMLRSKSLAGIMTTATGRELTFAIFVNDVPIPQGIGPGREGKTIGKLCEILFETCK